MYAYHVPRYASGQQVKSPTCQLADSEIKSPNSEMLKSGYLYIFAFCICRIFLLTDFITFTLCNIIYDTNDNARNNRYINTITHNNT